ncbi:MAG: hypothetical protein V3U47_03620, partial [Acidimicrobiia bacterium]
YDDPHGSPFGNVMARLAMVVFRAIASTGIRSEGRRAPLRRLLGPRFTRPFLTEAEWAWIGKRSPKMGTVLKVLLLLGGAVLSN